MFHYTSTTEYTQPECMHREGSIAVIRKGEACQHGTTPQKAWGRKVYGLRQIKIR